MRTMGTMDEGTAAKNETDSGAADGVTPRGDVRETTAKKERARHRQKNRRRSSNATPNAGHNGEHAHSRALNQAAEKARAHENQGTERGRKSQAAEVAPDAALPEKVPDDPRKIAGAPLGKAQLAAMGKGVQYGRNTENFDPASTLVRPSMRILVGSPSAEKYDRPIKHDDVVIVPEFFCAENDWSLYYTLIEEMTAVQTGAREQKGSEWISWHEGAHLICKNPTGSKTFAMIQDRMGDYFGISRKSVGTRFNWYRDASDWKPFHHDSAAFNPHRAKNQNCTVGVSFGGERELAFLHAKDPDMKIYFPQKNGTLFFFGRDVNINWKHGVNALSYDEQLAQLGKGRISIILWGLAANCVDEAGSPPMLPYSGPRK
ncbi:hypothetical protein FVE85_6597 [Porphyridium purpureum]|uniref:Fe2OG dioxygenase domain-containing protein n=1 Tax=Porphyridium purpureum TaxID=35688 RepID=A0A5J4Z7F0_PORPP|nr:hypothetical protein FVE85_6597 [Porphyridium purpureum]|eukprot:POR5667..scf295_1